MMQDLDSNPDLIACLLPANGNPQTLQQTLRAIHMSENRGRYFPPNGEIESENRSRESTISLEDVVTQAPNYTPPGLRLTFSAGPKAGGGFVIGTDRSRCDIVLPNLGKISRRHCSLTFDAQRRLILRDFSRHGTILTYDGKGGEIRHHFTWILSGKFVEKVKRLIIQFQELQFQIIILKHETHLDLYMKNIDQFLLQANVDDELTFGALGIQSTSSTAHQSGVLTPQTPIYVGQERIGSGNFSHVNRAWDVSTGLVYASKEFLNMTTSRWRKEGNIMRKLSEIPHEHIVHFVALKELPSPQLILEYLPLGNLQDQHEQETISDWESLIVLCQSLDALTSIHQQNIVHRDIKPENILVQSRDPLHIKLSDFGLSKTTPDLQTFCGTRLYAAPEIYQRRRASYYTNAVDIWSLGVVVFHFAYGLPKLHTHDEGVPWCEKIVQRLNNRKSDTLVDLLSAAMLILEPEKRLPAEKCWARASKLLPSQSRGLTLSPASFGLDQHQIGYCADEGTESVQPSVRSKSLESTSQLLSETNNTSKQKDAEALDATVSRVFRNRSRSRNSIILKRPQSIQGARQPQIHKSQFEDQVRAGDEGSTDLFSDSSAAPFQNSRMRQKTKALKSSSRQSSIGAKSSSLDDLDPSPSPPAKVFHYSIRNSATQ